MDTAGHTPSQSTGPWYATWYGVLAVLVVAITVYVGCRMLVFDWYRTPSAAMLPTLRVNDVFFVSKLAYRGALPDRGDLIVFRGPDGVTSVKRVIGLPGEVVVYDRLTKQVTINGDAAELEMLGEYPGYPHGELARETIGRRSHSLLLIRDVARLGGTYDVPHGQYFVLGDNRDSSRDSRYAEFGFVPREAVFGKVISIWHATDDPARAAATPD